MNRTAFQLQIAHGCIQIPSAGMMHSDRDDDDVTGYEHRRKRVVSITSIHNPCHFRCMVFEYGWINTVLMIPSLDAAKIGWDPQIDNEKSVRRE